MVYKNSPFAAERFWGDPMKRIDLTGERFGSLTVIEYSPRKVSKKHRQAHWICLCDCGNILLVRSDNLREGRSTQCSVCRRQGGKPSVFIEGVNEHEN